MDQMKNTPQPHTTPEEDAVKGDTKKEEASHHGKSVRRRRCRWVTIPLKCIGVLLLIVLLIPVILYLPPVQNFVKDIACDIVRDKTGMNIDIERLRIRYPLDVSLQGVTVIEAKGDTMVRAREAIADVKLMPLLHLDIRLNRLNLLDGYYRMQNADSSMILKLRAGKLTVDSHSWMNVKTGIINLHQARLKDADVQVYMNVWKKKPSPESNPTQMRINIHDLQGENIRYSMSMLPTIDTLTLLANRVSLADAVLNLTDSDISARTLKLDGGSFTYITPTPEYVATHPAPIDTISSPSPPMKIRGDEVEISDFDILYATKGVKPQPGFDPSYVSLTDVNARIKDFYNESSTVTAPILALSGKERSGLTVTEANGLFGVDSTGLTLKDIHVVTPYSNADVTAGIPFTLMRLDPKAPLDIKVRAEIGLKDVEAFMPSVRTYTRYIPRRLPVHLQLDTRGTLSSAQVKDMVLNVPGMLRLKGRGYADNPLDFKRMRASVDIDGTLSNPSLISRYTKGLGVKIPPFSIRGRAGVDHENYTADLTMHTAHGRVAAKGHLSMNAESYAADINVDHLNIGSFMPELGIGMMTGHLKANGAGFDPRLPHAHTAVALDLQGIQYRNLDLHGITADVTLSEHRYTIDALSRNQHLDLDLSMAGEISRDQYSAHGYARIAYIDLEALGLSQDLNSGNADLRIDGYFNPTDWTGMADLTVSNLDWNLPDQYIHLPKGINIYADSSPGEVRLTLDSDRTHVAFESPRALRHIVDAFSDAAGVATAQFKHRTLDVDTLHRLLPPFQLNVEASGRGLIRQILDTRGMRVDTIHASLRNDSIITGEAGILSLNNGSMALDTLTLHLAQRGNLLDYKTHIGNRPGTLDEFARIDLNGYVGANRVSAYLRQYNLQGKTGYRFGLTGALMDSTISVHFTPLRATIAYLPWTFNSDNHLDYNLATRQVDANLNARSEESSIYIKTEPNLTDGGNDLRLNIANLKVQDFLQMSVMAPPISGSLNSDITLHYTGTELQGSGNIGMQGFQYADTRIGDIDLDLKAGVDFNGKSNVEAALNVDGQPHAMVLSMLLSDDEETPFEPEDVTLHLDRLPMRVVNPFIEADLMSMDGTLSGDLDLKGGIRRPVLNGAMHFDDGAVYIPIMGSSLKLDTKPLTVSDNVVRFDRFQIFGANSNPLVIDGEVDATRIDDILLNVRADARNFQLINTKYQSKGDVYGKIYLDFGATARGSMQRMDLRANLTVLGNTNCTYVMSETPASLSDGDMENVVKFVNFNDTTTVARADSVASSLNMRINATLAINPGTQVEVLINGAGRDKVQLSPSGSVTYFQNYMGDATLNGQIYSGAGMARYTVPLLGEKTFQIDPTSYALWNGDMMNPTLSLRATDQIKANVVQSGSNSQLVNFLVTLNATGTLSAPVINFDLSTDDDMTIQNQLQSMSADQRSTQAMNLLVTGQYSNLGTKTDTGPVTGTVFSLLTSQLNSLIAQNIRGVDLTFGVDQYDKTLDGESSVTTSYSYQVSKSLFDNKFKINVGGNYSTDASADENLAQNLISDVSMEYILRQTSATSIFAKLFRHQGYESILEGEVIETGVGIVMKRRISNLKHLFTFRRSRPATLPADTASPKEKEHLSKDTSQQDTIH